eukprot:Protomagalhaensia_wolfi_Nauph_80__1353@NODE_1807_length_1326_cov_209_775447_g1410_i0_p1_GENE_NODE_1807_length_1326_cov_209_775447_g1410_i0NODE_1807_length_1326_cov_209_775447_g1410_i0_p1_ORF_typecomplete_len235_score37_26_NODE_1807_length_1326_cov_209_775447_g1410_i052756
MRFSTVIFLCGSLLAEGRRTVYSPLHTRIAALHEFDCSSANTDECEQKCLGSSHCAPDMTDRGQWRQCFLDLGAECSVESYLERRTNRTGGINFGPNAAGFIGFISQIDEYWEGGLYVVHPTLYTHHIRMWHDNARECDNLVVTVASGSNSPTTSRMTDTTFHFYEPDLLETEDMSSTWYTFYGQFWVPEQLSCIPPEEFFENKTLRVEAYYKSRDKIRMYGTDTINHLALYEP